MQISAVVILAAGTRFGGWLAKLLFILGTIKYALSLTHQARAA
jgi:hypothetical protein